MSRVFIVFYFLVLLATLMVTTRTVHGPWLFLFRAFFPNWKFYHSLGWQPNLFVRTRTLGTKDLSNTQVQSGANDWTEFSLIYPRAKRSVLSLFHNPSVNIDLAHQNLVEHLSTDLQELQDQEDPRKLVSYQLVDRRVRHWIAAQRGAEQKDHKLQSKSESRETNLGISHLLEYQFEIRLQLNSPQIKARLVSAQAQAQAQAQNEDSDLGKEQFHGLPDLALMGAQEGVHPANENQRGHFSEQAQLTEDVHVLMISPIERIELFTKPQPSGLKVNVSDAQNFVHASFNSGGREGELS